MNIISKTYSATIISYLKKLNDVSYTTNLKGGVSNGDNYISNGDLHV